MKTSIWDKMKGFATPYAADDDYDDEADDELDDGFAEEEEEERTAPRFSRSASFRNESSKADYAGASAKTEPLGDSFAAASSAPASSFENNGSFASAGFSGHAMNSSAARQQLVLFQPQSFNEISEIAQNLRIKKGIVLNLEGVDHNLAMRCVDFMSGCAFAVDGTVKKVANAIYVFCPSNMEVVGDLPTMQADIEDIL